MNRQKGSILIGVMAMSVAMTVAASGLILLSANTDMGGSANLESMALRNAAESGAQMGVRWIRNYLETDIPTTWNDSLVLTPGVDGFMNLDGIKVKVKFVDDPGAGGGHFAVKTWATYGPKRDTLEIIWQVNSLNPPTSGSGVSCNANLGEWAETLHPGNS
jgi:hypothetical protein